MMGGHDNQRRLRRRDLVEQPSVHVPCERNLMSGFEAPSMCSLDDRSHDLTDRAVRVVHAPTHRSRYNGDNVEPLGEWCDQTEQRHGHLGGLRRPIMGEHDPARDEWLVRTVRADQAQWRRNVTHDRFSDTAMQRRQHAPMSMGCHAHTGRR